MKVFLSWSGQSSNLIARELRNWLPAVLQSTRPWYSPDDIAKGRRWNADISQVLEDSRVGILCVTRENIAAPWLMFEAGALAKNLEHSRVIPLLFGIEPADLSGPLAQFQAARFEKPDVRRMLGVINTELKESGLEPSVLDAVFEKWWPDLEAGINAIPDAHSTKRGNVRSDRALLEELLELVRSSTNHRERPGFDRVHYPQLGDVPIERLDVPARTLQNLRAENIATVGSLMEYSETDLLKTPNIGRRALTEIQDALRELGLSLTADKASRSGA